MEQIIINGKMFTLYHVDPIFGSPFPKHEWGVSPFKPNPLRYEWQRPLATKEVSISPKPVGNPRDN